MRLFDVRKSRQTRRRSASPLAGLTPEQLQACITEGVRQLHGVRTGPVIDVECVEVPNGNA